MAVRRLLAFAGTMLGWAAATSAQSPCVVSGPTLIADINSSSRLSDPAHHATVGGNDCQIVATARCSGLVVVTHDVDELRRVPGARRRGLVGACVMDRPNRSAAASTPSALASTAGRTSTSGPDAIAVAALSPKVCEPCTIRGID